MKRLLMGLLLAGPCLALAQKALPIGTKVPDIRFTQVLNYKQKTAKLSDFKGKLVILDLWSTTCSSCIAAFPHMEQLQKQFSDKIQILLVDPYLIKYDTEERVKHALALMKARTGYYPSLPIPIRAGIIDKYFPRRSVPHEVWIGPDGRLLAITEMAEITAEHIQSFLNKEPLSLPVKNDWAFNREQPMKDGRQVYRAMFSSGDAGLGHGSGTRYNDQKQVTGVYMLNEPLADLISAAYPEYLGSTQPNRIIYESDSLARFQAKYSYDLTLPPALPEKVNISTEIRADLSRAFHISVRKESRPVTAYIISNAPALPNAYSVRKADLQKSTLKKYIHHLPVNQLADLLDRYAIPVITDITVKNPIDIDFPEGLDITNQETVLQFIQTLGIIVRKERRMLDVIIISDKN